MASAIDWFEIPAADYGRAKAFYEKIFGIEMLVMDPAAKNAMFPSDWQKGEIGGSVVQREDLTPSDKGTLIFLNGGEDLSSVLDKVEGAGGKVVVPKTRIPMGDAGYMGAFLDTEGNKIGLHSMQ